MPLLGLGADDAVQEHIMSIGPGARVRARGSSLFTASAAAGIVYSVA